MENQEETNSEIDRYHSVPFHYQAGTNSLQLQKVFTALEEFGSVDKINHSHKKIGDRNTTSRIRPKQKLQILFKQTKAVSLDVDIHMHEKKLLLVGWDVEPLNDRFG